MHPARSAWGTPFDHAAVFVDLHRDVERVVSTRKVTTELIHAFA
jgi:hypothetical protein